MSCDTVIPFDDSHVDLILDQKNLVQDKTLCLIIVGQEQHRIQLNIHQVFDVDLFIHQQNETRWIQSTMNNYQVKEEIVMITIDKVNRQSRVNISWIIDICSDEQILCHGEQKCYSKNQRCDGLYLFPSLLFRYFSSSGHWNCLNGDDELGCSPLCPTSFACTNHYSSCFHLSERCNGHAYCSSLFDENFCSPSLCNTNNGTFLCRNQLCIYESWVCDGTDDCNDHSDEDHCSSRLPRRVITAAIIGGSICLVLFLIALSCSCKLFHLRLSQRQQSIRLINRSNDTQRLAPPSYNQTIGVNDDQEERLALLMDNLRLAGFGEVISISRTSTSRWRSWFTREESRPVTSIELPPAYVPDDQTPIIDGDSDDDKLLIP